MIATQTTRDTKANGFLKIGRNDGTTVAAVRSPATNTKKLYFARIPAPRQNPKARYDGQCWRCRNLRKTKNVAAAKNVTRTECDRSRCDSQAICGKKSSERTAKTRRAGSLKTCRALA